MAFNTLTWGVKESFRNYVEGAGGAISASDGATRLENGTFVLNAMPGGDLTFDANGNASGKTQFTGTLNFQAHGGMLNSTLTELAIEVRDGELVLTSLDAPMNQDHCPIATLTVIESRPDGAVTLNAEITMDGMYQIADNYPPGTALDQVLLD